MRKDSPAYRKAARLFLLERRLAGVRCPVTGGEVEQVHHKFGRLGKLLMWVGGWIAVSAVGHDWIHRNIAEARKRGLICPIGLWNSQKVIVDNVT